MAHLIIPYSALRPGFSLRCTYCIIQSLNY